MGRPGPRSCGLSPRPLESTPSCVISGMLLCLAGLSSASVHGMNVWAVTAELLQAALTGHCSEMGLALFCSPQHRAGHTQMVLGQHFLCICN